MYVIMFMTKARGTSANGSVFRISISRILDILTQPPRKGMEHAWFCCMCLSCCRVVVATSRKLAGKLRICCNGVIWGSNRQEGNHQVLIAAALLSTSAATMPMHIASTAARAPISICGTLSTKQLAPRLSRRSLGLPRLSFRTSHNLFATSAKDGSHNMNHDSSQSRFGWILRLQSNLWFRRSLRAFRVGIVSFGLYKVG